MLGEQDVEDDDEHAEPLRGQTARLLGSEEGLARACAAGDGNAGLAREHVEHLVLLLGEAVEAALFLCELECERRAQIERVCEQSLEPVDPARSKRCLLVRIEPVAEQPLDLLGKAGDVRVVEDELPREVRSQRLLWYPAVGEGDGVPEADRFVASARGARERAAERMRGAPRLAPGILDLRLALLAGGEPLPDAGVVADRAALHLEGEHAVVGVGEDEVGLALLRATVLAGELPGDRVERNDVICRLVAEALEELALGVALVLDSVRRGSCVPSTNPETALPVLRGMHPARSHQCQQ